MQSAHPPEGATIGRNDLLDGRGGAWNASKSSSSAAGRSAWRSPSNLGMRGISCALVERRTELRAHPQGPEPDPSHARAFLFLGHRRRAARRALHAAGLRDRRDHRLRQPEQPILARAGGPRARARVTTSRTTTGCRSTRWRRCCGRRWRPCRTSRAGSAGPPPRSSRTRAASRVTVTKDGAQRGARGRLCRRLRRRPLDGARADRHRARRQRFRSAHGAGRVPLARIARRARSAFRRSRSIG